MSPLARFTSDLLTITLAKQLKDRRPFDIGLNRQGAVRQKKEEVHEKQGHKFVTQQFYNIMRCALCGEFLKYAAGMQCADCKYTCHRKCYPKVVTKCISKANYETDPDEEKINHRIPHRFEGFSNISANWCCHCGYLLPFGRKNAKRCTGMWSRTRHRHVASEDILTISMQNVALLATLSALTLCLTSVECRWKQRTKFWRL